MSPNFKAVLTASPRLEAFSFRNRLWRCVSTDGTLRPSCCASLLVGNPFATPRRICISLDVKATVFVVRDSGLCSATRRRTSGIILRGTGLSLRTADQSARCSSAGPTSLRTYPEHPARIILKRSSLDSDTVHAMTFVSGWWANSSTVVAAPSMPGICTSIRTRSALTLVMATSASSPEDASPTSRRPVAVPSIVRAAARGSTLSSTTRTRYSLRSNGAFGMPRSLARRR